MEETRLHTENLALSLNRRILSSTRENRDANGVHDITNADSPGYDIAASNTQGHDALNMKRR